jgi:hypothetical protein
VVVLEQPAYLTLPYRISPSKASSVSSREEPQSSLWG